MWRRGRAPAHLSCGNQRFPHENGDGVAHAAPNSAAKEGLRPLEYFEGAHPFRRGAARRRSLQRRGRRRGGEREAGEGLCYDGAPNGVDSALGLKKGVHRHRQIKEMKNFGRGAEFPKQDLIRSHSAPLDEMR